MQDRYNVPLKQLLTFKPAGAIGHHIVAESIVDLITCFQRYPNSILLGKGSNTLLRGDELTDPVITLSPSFPMPTGLASSLSGSAESVWLSAGMGVHAVMTYCQSIERSGLEFAAGVPAGIGGMIAMNFGCWGHDIQEVLAAAVVMTRSGKVSVVPVSECGFGYRTSRFPKEQEVVLGGFFKLNHMPADRIKTLIRDRITQRLAKQPLRALTFGSVFKNPPNAYAAQLIESAGLKGRHFGPVQLSDIHANFMVHSGDATVRDALVAIQEIRTIVCNTCGILLEPEVHYYPCTPPLFT